MLIWVYLLLRVPIYKTSSSHFSASSFRRVLPRSLPSPAALLRARSAAYRAWAAEFRSPEYRDAIKRSMRAWGQAEVSGGGSGWS